jgi:hypothetical protein
MPLMIYRREVPIDNRVAHAILTQSQAAQRAVAVEGSIQTSTTTPRQNHHVNAHHNHHREPSARHFRINEDLTAAKPMLPQQWDISGDEDDHDDGGDGSDTQSTDQTPIDSPDPSRGVTLERKIVTLESPGGGLLLGTRKLRKAKSSNATATAIAAVPAVSAEASSTSTTPMASSAVTSTNGGAFAANDTLIASTATLPTLSTGPGVTNDMTIATSLASPGNRIDVNGESKDLACPLPHLHLDRPSYPNTLTLPLPSPLALDGTTPTAASSHHHGNTAVAGSALTVTPRKRRKSSASRHRSSAAQHGMTINSNTSATSTPVHGAMPHPSHLPSGLHLAAPVTPAAKMNSANPNYPVTPSHNHYPSTPGPLPHPFATPDRKKSVTIPADNNNDLMSAPMAHHGHTRAPSIAAMAQPTHDSKPLCLCVKVFVAY